MAKIISSHSVHNEVRLLKSFLMAEQRLKKKTAAGKMTPKSDLFKNQQKVHPEHQGIVTDEFQSGQYNFDCSAAQVLKLLYPYSSNNHTPFSIISTFFRITI